MKMVANKSGWPCVTIPKISVIPVYIILGETQGVYESIDMEQYLNNSEQPMYTNEGRDSTQYTYINEAIVHEDYVNPRPTQNRYVNREPIEAQEQEANIDVVVVPQSTQRDDPRAEPYLHNNNKKPNSKCFTFCSAIDRKNIIIILLVIIAVVAVLAAIFFALRDGKSGGGGNEETNVDGWTQWSTWGRCMCWNGTETQQRFRLCTLPKKHCPGADTETKNCSISTSCPTPNDGENVSKGCSSSPCNNGATCVDVNVDTFICVCRGGFFGVTCENSEYCYILRSILWCDL